MSRVIERAVLTQAGRDVGVRVERNGIKITWTCGDTRFFAADDLGEAIAHADLMAAYPDVQLHLRDSNRNLVVVRHEGSTLYVGDSGRVDGTAIDWREFRKALRKSAKELPPPPPPAPAPW